jgi:hypothetical protein
MDTVEIFCSIFISFTAFYFGYRVYQLPDLPIVMGFVRVMLFSIGIVALLLAIRHIRKGEG